MQDSLARTVSGPGTLGVFNYLDATTRPSLFRNGEVLTRRNADGSDFGWRGVNLEGKGTGRKRRTAGMFGGRPSWAIALRPKRPGNQ